MKIVQVKIKNFRGYRNEISIDIGNLNVFVGKNDIGKSSILEALDIFFNNGKGTIKLDKDDINIESSTQGDSDIRISVVFDDLPNEIIIDSTNPTTLQEEYLLNKDKKLEILKVYPSAGKEKVYIIANHPTHPQCSELHLMTNAKLKEIVENNNIECSNKTINAKLRKAIWEYCNTNDNLNLQDVEIETNKEDAKKIWDQLYKYMPLYALFQSDRENDDGDSEVQDPMKIAAAKAIKEQDIMKQLENITNKVKNTLIEVSNKTLDKLREMNPEIAATLSPSIPSFENLKWADLFKGVSIIGDGDIPINKRGSGVKRLILLNFFRAEAERKQNEVVAPSIIYAIEEPETSQHPDYQNKLIKSLRALSDKPNIQIFLTTHSPTIVKMLDFNNIKIIRQNQNSKEIVNVEQQVLPIPSLNEVNFLAFGESDEYYHNELYGLIESNSKIKDYEKAQEKTKTYAKLNKNNKNELQNVILSTYIRHQIHHPENTLNDRFTNEELQQSIKDMRDFIINNNLANNGIGLKG